MCTHDNRWPEQNGNDQLQYPLSAALLESSPEGVCECECVRERERFTVMGVGVRHCLGVELGAEPNPS